MSALPRRFFTPTALVILFAVVVGTLSAAGCGRPHVKGTVAVDTILKAWGADGFDTTTVENLDEAGTWNAGACSRGTVMDLDVLLCEYASDEALAAGEQKMMSDWAEESVPTGVVARTSRTLLAVADRNKADVGGRTITRLIKTFRDQR